MNTEELLHGESGNIVNFGIGSENFRVNRNHRNT